MGLDSWTDKKLRLTNKVLLVISIFGLLLMCIALGVVLFQISNGNESKLTFLIPTVFAPITFIPVIFSGIVSSEIKKRKENP